MCMKVKDLMIFEKPCMWDTTKYATISILFMHRVVSHELMGANMKGFCRSKSRFVCLCVQAHEAKNYEYSALCSM